MIDEGYIKYTCDWERCSIIKEHEIMALNSWRNRLYQLGLIGVYDNGIGFGNVSQRVLDQEFIISGTQTGSLSTLTAEHYSRVVHCNVDNNYLQCVGMIQASSESMTHYAVYQSFKEIQYVFHIHHFNMWKKHLFKLPTTHPDIAYGTPEMAHEITRLFKETNVAKQKILLMAGH
ncbi:MAG: class II aldolase/adducin family protein, partial [Bacteroidota bacterium]